MGLSKLRQLGSIAKVGQALSASLKGGVKTQFPPPVGIDFGTGALKVLQVSGSEPPQLIAAANVDTPDELIAEPAKRLEFQIGLLPKLLREGGFKSKRAVCAVPAWATTCKHMQIARTDATTVLSAIESAIPVQLGRDPSELVYRHLTVGGQDKPGAKMEILVTAVERTLVEQLMAAIHACKMEPVGIHSEFSAAMNAFAYVHRRAGDVLANTLYIDIGHGTTTVAISHGMELAFSRVIELGGRHLDEALAKQLGCDVKEARRRRWNVEKAQTPAPALSMAERALGKDAVTSITPPEERRETKLPPGFGPQVLDQAAVPLGPDQTNLNESLDLLTDEVRMCMRYHSSQCPELSIDRVVFIGGESRHMGLCQHIAKALKLPAQMADPLARVSRTGKEPCRGVDFSQPQPGWAVALGLCVGPTDL
ncbi:MAG: pilus assembly protein PilM [Planctomycetes bacterium]|nr:pilus assembly protein PilM [Planctomycetota bacterium]